MLKISAIIQARTTSSRLPNKVLLPLPYGSKTSALEQMVRRLQKCRMIDNIVIATTINDADAPIVKLCKKMHVSCFRGDENNVLARYYFAAKADNADIVIRMTSDCPCIDPIIADKTIKLHLKYKYDYTTSGKLPVGMHVEAFSFNVLEEAFRRSTKEYEREHVTPYIYSSHPERFKIGALRHPHYLQRPDIRVTLDTQEDYALLCLIYDKLYDKNDPFSLKDIVGLFNKEPWIALINKKIIQKKFFDTLEGELQEAVKVLDAQDLKKAASYIRKTIQ